MRASIDKPQLRVVAVSPLTAGQLISASDLATRPVVGAQTGAGFDRPEQLVGRALRRSVDAGELLSAQDIEETVPVVRTSAAQAAGAQFDLNAARVEMIPRSRAPAGAIIRLDDVKMVKLRRDLAADQVLMSDDIVDARPVVVATRNLMRGDIIDASMLTLQEIDRRGVPPDHLVSLAGLEQAEVMGPVRAGEPLRSSQLRPSLMVKKGQQVVLTVASGGMEISVRVEALEDARLGDQVKLRNPESGRAIAGVVTGRGSARTL
jgi:flagella basal body P-ring formation protein FlgA